MLPTNYLQYTSIRPEPDDGPGPGGAVYEDSEPPKGIPDVSRNRRTTNVSLMLSPAIPSPRAVPARPLETTLGTDTSHVSSHGPRIMSLPHLHEIQDSPCVLT